MHEQTLHDKAVYRDNWAATWLPWIITHYFM